MPLEIVSFLSHQIDHNTTKGTILQRMRQHLAKAHLAKTAASAIASGQRQAKPHLPMKWLQMLTAASQ